MNCFTRFGDELVVRLITYGIFLHATICIAALGMVIYAPFVVTDFMGDIRLTGKVLNEATVVTVPLVNRSEERGDARTGKFLYFVELPSSPPGSRPSPIRVATPYLRSTPVGDLDSLDIYVHPALSKPSNRRPSIIEVPEEATWSSIFHALRGRTITSAAALLLLQLVLGVVVLYVSIRGYFLIRYGARRKRR